jgi:hypothetical protein
MGTPNITEVACDTGAGSCVIPVPAPAAALVFLSQDALGASGAQASPTTYATTARTRAYNTATLASSVIATMNGMNAGSRRTGSTSKGSISGAGRTAAGLGAVGALVGAAGAWVVAMAL